MTERIPERRSKEPFLFMLRQIYTRQEESRRDLLQHITQEDRRFDQILREVHEVRVSVAKARLAHTDHDSLKGVLSADLRPVKMLSVLTYFFMVISLCLYDGDDLGGDFAFMLKLMPLELWIGLFMAMLFARLSGLFGWPGKRFTHMTVPAVGVWLWSLTFSSFSLLSPMDGIGLLLLVPLFSEVWILARAYAYWRGTKWI